MLRTLMPFDTNLAICKSREKNESLLIVDEEMYLWRPQLNTKSYPKQIRKYFISIRTTLFNS